MIFSGADHSVSDTAKAQGKTYKRREFVLPPTNIPKSAEDPPRTVRDSQYIDELDSQVEPTTDTSGDGFDLVTFDVVKSDNTAGQYQWRAEEVVT